MLIRERSPDDLEECVRVLGEVHHTDGYPANWPADPAGWLTRPGLIAAWVAVHDGHLIGHVGLSRPRPGHAAVALFTAGSGADGGVAMMSRLFVDPAARGLGAGTALAEHVVHEARARGLHAVLDVLDAEDSAAIALYERLGWRLLGRVPQHWGPRQVTVRCYAAPD
ncbi:MAG TPA: GNAT family N-acetyltransferase [Streptosporangiaceae bacterium]